MILQIATALAIGAYVVLSKDTQPKHADATLASRFSTWPSMALIAAVALSSRRSDPLRHGSRAIPNIV